jgi:hypothetical protein
VPIVPFILATFVALTVAPREVWAQTAEVCTASVLNRVVPVDPRTGAFEIPNLPVTGTFWRVRVTCTDGAVTRAGQSSFFEPIANGTAVVGAIPLGVLEPPPTAIRLVADRSTVSPGGTAQLTVTGTFPDGSTRDLTAGTAGTTYRTSNPAIASVSPAGVAAGTAILSATHEGVLATVAVTVAGTADTDGDGMPDDYELANGLNPNDPGDATADPDGDELTNLQEFQRGTNPQLADTDGDGLLDGQEVALGTNPLVADTDGDGLPDGDEVLAYGSDPLAPDSDGDGLPDGVEVAIRGNPFDARPGDDDDGDALSNLDEVLLGTSPVVTDTDSDGTPDGLETLRRCDPLTPELTTVVGLVVDTVGGPIAAARVEVGSFGGRQGLTGADGRFTLTGAGGCRRPLRVLAVARIDGSRVRGVSSARAPVVGGVTDVGSIQVSPDPLPRYPAPRFTAAPEPRDLAAADVNGDGIPDLLALGRLELSLLLGHGDGTFVPEQRVGLGGSAVAVGDLDGDGRLDLATADEFGGPGFSGAVLIVRGDAGGFGIPLSLPTAGRPVSVALADLDADGVLDLLAASFTAGEVSVRFGVGDGTFEPEQRAPVGPHPRGLAVADLNGDTVPDLVVTNTSASTVSVLLGLGAGALAARQPYATVPGPFAVAVGDLNGDGWPDLVVGSGSGLDVSILLGAGGGVFQPEQRVAVGSGASGLRIADVNGDGRPDLVAAGFGEAALLLGRGDGTFEAAQPVLGAIGAAVALADFDGNGTLDVATAEQQQRVTVVLGTGDGTFVTRHRQLALAAASALALGDFTGDGLIDVATVDDSSSSASLLPGQGDGTLQPAQSISVSSVAKELASADLNGDGRPDLVTANLHESDVSVLLATGAGGFQPERRVPVGSRPFAVAVADLDGDGSGDLVTANFGSGDVSVALGNGDGTFRPAQSFAVGEGPQWVAVADVNRDTRPHVLVARTFNEGFAGDVTLLLGNGDGTLLPPVRFAVRLTSGGWQVVAAGDLDGDGAPDVVALSGSRLVLLLGRGNGTFEPPEVLPVAGDARRLVLADVNRDGFVDLVTAEDDGGTATVRLGIGDGSFETPEQYAAGARPPAVAVGDLTGDGRPELVTGSSFSPGEVSVLPHR